MQFQGDGSSTVFNVPFGIRTADHLLVTLSPDASLGFTTVPIDDSGGFVLKFDRPPDAGSIITVLRTMPIERQTDFGQQTEFTAAAINAELADQTLRQQELKRDVRRSLRLFDDDPGGLVILPRQSDRAGKYLKFDDAGKPVPSAGTADVNIDFEAYAEAGDLGLQDELLVQQSGQVRTSTLGFFAAWLRASALALPVITAGQIGLAGDFDFATGAGTDDAPKLQKQIDAYAALSGGGTFFLSADPGKAFYLNGRIRAGNNIRLIWLSPVALGQRAGISIRGSLAGVPNKDSFRLSADATLGGSTLAIDTTPHGGGALSTHFDANDLISIAGLLDSAGTPLEEQDVTVLSINDVAGTVTIRETLSFAFRSSYPAGAYETAFGVTNRSRLSKVRKAALSGNAAEGADVVAVASGELANLAVGDVVLAEDDGIQSDVAGSGTGRIKREPNRIAAIGEGGANNVRLERRLGRALTTAKRARLTVVATASGASIEGASATFTTTATASGINPPTFECRYGFKSEIAGCHVPNEDSFGSRGNGVRVDLSLSCKVTDCLVDSPKFFAAGEGYGVYMTHSADCTVDRCIMIGCRHSYIWFNASDCDAFQCRSAKGLLSDFDWHGGDEVGCVAYDPEVTGGSVSAGSALTAFAFGNATGLVQPRSCGVQGGTVEHYNAGIATCIRFEAGANGCFVRGTRFRDVNDWLYASDAAAAAALTSTDCLAEGNVVDTVAGWIVQALGNANGSANRTVANLRISRNSFRGISRCINARQASGLRIDDNGFDGITPDASFTYVFNLFDITSLLCSRNRVNGGSRGFSVQNCPSGIILSNRVASLVNGTLLDDKGGSTGLAFVDNLPAGFVPTFGRLTTAGITEHPRVQSVTIADGGVFKTKPVYPSGNYIIQRNASNGPRAEVAFSAGSTTFSTVRTSSVPGGATYAWASVNGPLTGAEAANTLNVGSDTDGTVHIGNKSGASMTFDIMWS